MKSPNKSAKKRKFNGKYYIQHDYYTSSKKVKAEKKRLKKKGYSVRTYTWRGYTYIYKRKS